MNIIRISLIYCHQMGINYAGEILGLYYCRFCMLLKNNR